MRSVVGMFPTTPEVEPNCTTLTPRLNLDYWWVPISRPFLVLSRNLSPGGLYVRGRKKEKRLFVKMKEVGGENTVRVRGGCEVRRHPGTIRTRVITGTIGSYGLDSMSKNRGYLPWYTVTLEKPPVKPLYFLYSRRICSTVLFLIHVPWSY